MNPFNRATSSGVLSSSLSCMDNNDFFPLSRTLCRMHLSAPCFKRIFVIFKFPQEAAVLRAES